MALPLRLAFGSSDKRAALRVATFDDIESIVDLLSADELGATRDGITKSGDLAAYRAAFAALDRDPAHLLLVAAHADEIIATLQLSFLPGMARRGAWRAQIEAVRVHEDYRDEGLGQALVSWSIEEARRRGCALVQLTSDSSRASAHQFYEGLGFAATHEGFKLDL